MRSMLSYIPHSCVRLVVLVQSVCAAAQSRPACVLYLTPIVINLDFRIVFVSFVKNLRFQLLAKRI